MACLHKRKISVGKLYVLATGVAMVLLCLQSWHMSLHHLLFQSNIYKTTWNIRYVDPDEPNLRTVKRAVNDNKVNTSVHTYTDPDWVQTGILFELPLGNVSILSANGRNRTSDSAWDDIILNGWEEKTQMNDSYRCCLYYADGGLEQVDVTHKNHWLKCKRVRYIATQITCPNVRSEIGQRPRSVSLIPSLKLCSNDSKSSMPVTFPPRQENNSIGLCAKIAYGSVSANRLIEWYEVQKRMGVSKVVTYTYNVTGQALHVLQHYQKMGLVDIYPYQYPHIDILPRNVGDKTAQVFNDEQVAAFDCVEKLGGYQFVGLLDHDEFLIPGKSGIPTWHHLFNMLLRQHPEASGFSFRTELFVIDWRKENSSRPFSVTQFLNRTRPMWDRRKNIFMPDRVIPGSVWTHSYEDRPGYKRLDVSSGYAALKHYRTCRKEWLKNNNCFRRRRYQDERLVNVLSQINGTIERVQRKIHLL